MSDVVQLWTVGHSNHTVERFLELLGEFDIEVVVDVRSEPYSSYSKHFCQETLRRSLTAAGLSYLFMGRELGGRPPEPEFYDEEGHVLYGELAATERFGGGLRRLIDGAERYRVAVMCSEENPMLCHRRQLIARALREESQRVAIAHIRGTGEVVDDVQLDRDADGTGQLGLTEEQTPWRSPTPARGDQKSRAGDPVSRRRLGRAEDQSVQPELFGKVATWD
ncbi:MAG: DUF488 domain-containing protein [bacterium]|nr:DUF488 domain-containing protein [bacterium]